MKIVKYIMSGLLLLGATSMLTSCAQEDPIIVDSDTVYDNPFDVDDNDNSPEAQLRREFYKETGVFIVFHNLLRTYTDRFGNVINETVDMNYELNGEKGETYAFDEFEDIESQRRAAEILKKYFLPRISGGKLKPFAFLAVDQIYKGRDEEEIPMVDNFRACAVSMNALIDADSPEEIKTLVNESLKSFVNSKVNYKDEIFEDFVAVSEEYYLEDLVDYFSNWKKEQDITLVYELGFIGYNDDEDGPKWDYFYSAKVDFASFIDLIFEKSDAEIREEYGEYPLIIRKYEMMKNILEDLGCSF